MARAVKKPCSRIFNVFDRMQGLKHVGVHCRSAYGTCIMAVKKVATNLKEWLGPLSPKSRKCLNKVFPCCFSCLEVPRSFECCLLVFQGSSGVRKVSKILDFLEVVLGIFETTMGRRTRKPRQSQKTLEKNNLSAKFCHLPLSKPF